MNKLHKKNDIFTIGFALFAMLFGAGNLIFPPYLGWKLGDYWFLGFILYLAVDVGFSVVALLVIAESEHGSDVLTKKLGPVLSPVFSAIVCICIGPAIAIPRVAAVTYEVGILPMFPSANSIVCTAVFFILAWLLCISKSTVVDIVGKVLAPLMVVALVFMIAKGIIIPIGTPTAHSSVSEAVETGITSGYQTMDMMAVSIFAITLLASVNQKGYTEKKEKFSVICYAGVVAAVLLFVVYGGLSYLGANLMGMPTRSTQVEILLGVTYALMGKPGQILLGIIVALACFTTVIGLITAISEFFEQKLHIKYSIIVTVFTIISFVISNVGTNRIIAIAAPVLNVIYPVLIFLTFCCIAKDRIPTLAIRCGAGFAFVSALIQQIEVFMNVSGISGYLPFDKWGFGWIVPALVGLAIGALVGKIKRKSAV